MTEATQAPAPEATPEAKPIDVSALLGKHAIVGLAYAEIKSNAEAHNTEAAKLAAASGSVEDVVKAYLNDVASAGDAKAQKLADAVETAREALAKQESALNEYLTGIATKVVESSKGDTEALTTSVSKLASEVNASLKLFRTVVGSKDYSEEEVNAIIGSLPALSGKGRRASTGSNAGAGGWRIRGYDFFDADGNLLTVKVDLKRKVDGKDVVLKDQPVSNTAAVMVYGKCGADTVRNSFAEAQGTTDSSAFKPEVTFTVLGEDNVSRTVTARKNVEASAEEAAANGADVK